MLLRKTKYSHPFLGAPSVVLFHSDGTTPSVLFCLDGTTPSGFNNNPLGDNNSLGGTDNGQVYIQPLAAAPLDHSNILSPTTISLVSVTVGCGVKALLSSPVKITASLTSPPLRKTRHRDEEVTPVT